MKASNTRISVNNKYIAQRCRSARAITYTKHQGKIVTVIKTNPMEIASKQKNDANQLSTETEIRNSFNLK